MGQPNTYYADSASGNDANDGSSGSPWQTIQGALDQINKGPNGDALILRNTAPYSVPAQLSYASYGDPGLGQPIWITGCTIEPGDGGQATINCPAGLQDEGKNDWHLESLIIDSKGYTGRTAYANTNSSIVNCQILGRVAFNSGVVYCSYFQQPESTGNTVFENFSTATIKYCVFESRQSGSISSLIDLNSNFSRLSNSLVIGRVDATRLIETNGLWAGVDSCTLIGTAGSTAIVATANERQQPIIGNVFSGFDTVYDGGPIEPDCLVFNKFHNCNHVTGGNVELLGTVRHNTNQTLVSDPFVSASNGDYRLSISDELTVGGYPFSGSPGGVGVSNGGGPSGYSLARLAQ